MPEKMESERERLELASVTEVDESILADCINDGIRETTRYFSSAKNYLIV